MFNWIKCLFNGAPRTFKRDMQVATRMRTTPMVH